MPIKNYTGTLNDELIKSQCDKGILISKFYNVESVCQACYELSSSGIYYDTSKNFERIDITEDNYDYILIKPKQSIVIITKEELKLPNNVLGRVLTKGKLFSIGLSPINTYADPGFEGNLGIILYNYSTNYLKIKEGEIIAKIEFSVLQNKVVNPYNGQHGYKTKIWPIPVEFSLDEAELNKDTRIGTVEQEIEQIYGPRYSAVIKRLLGFEKKLILATIAYLTFSIILFSFLLIIDEKELFSPFFSIIIGLISNVLFFILISKIEKRKR